MQRAHSVEYVAHDIRHGARRQVASDAEGELGFTDAHVVSAERHLRAAVECLLEQQAAGERAVDVDVRLARRACRGDLPPEERRRAARLEPRLDGVALLACPRTDVFRKRGETKASFPAFPEEVRSAARLRVFAASEGQSG